MLKSDLWPWFWSLSQTYYSDQDPLYGCFIYINILPQALTYLYLNISRILIVILFAYNFGLYVAVIFSYFNPFYDLIIDVHHLHIDHICMCWATGIYILWRCFLSVKYIYMLSVYMSIYLQSSGFKLCLHPIVYL